MKDNPISPVLALCALLGTAALAIADDYSIAWDTPSADHHGSMPLGNGDITLNAWFTKGGDLQFYIGKTDAWDENARLAKVGKVRLRFDPSPFVPDQPFRQQLNLEEGCIQITTRNPPQTTIRLWVDANNPVIQVTAESATPTTITASSELWRTNRYEDADVQVSDVFTNLKLANGKQRPLVIEPDHVLTGQADRIGWYHHNVKSVGPEMLAKVQGLAEFKQLDPLLHRTFGAMITAEKGNRLNDRALRSGPAKSHQFSVFVLTQHPSSPQAWVSDVEVLVRRVEAQSFTARLEAHKGWWKDFWTRSWIRGSVNTNTTTALASAVPGNAHPLRIGLDQHGGNKFSGELGRVSVFNAVLPEAEIRSLARADRAPLSAQDKMLVSTSDPGAVKGSPGWKFNAGITIEGWVRPEQLPGSGARLADKITPGGSDGFLLDSFPGNSLRFICGDTILQEPGALPAGCWTHVAAVADSSSGAYKLYVNGQLAATTSSAAMKDEAAYVSHMYALQRFVTACAGRGAYPIKFNGTLFTVPPGPTEKDPDFRRWGPGYWWQNTRLPYISLCTSGDFDLQKPLFRMYAQELLPLCRYRTKLYLGHEGAYYPECIMFWGAVFSETYGWTPFEQRKDKLQESGWHKWEWVGGLELCWMMLDFYEHTLDREFLRNTALPFTHEILTFFDQHYPTNHQGKLVMFPSQALETWWHCTNATPELAGCIAVAERLLSLPDEMSNPAEREFWTRFRAKLPPIPLRDVNGKKALAPAEFFANKSNIENPELYPVFPFRLFAFNRPNPEWARTALDHRWDRGHSGWRQDDIFMACLGLSEDARKAVVSRARSHDPGERFPAFWGPNYDWTPDQDHGGVLMKAFQSMLLQTDGNQIFLFPAWPKGWDAEFKLHAPYRTTLEGVYKAGKIVSLKVNPESRRADVVLPK